MQHVVPEDDIPVQAVEAVGVDAAPVVIVRGASVVLLAVGQFAADTDDEDCAELLGCLRLAFARADAGIHAEQFLGVDERDVVGQGRRDVRIIVIDHHLDFFQ